MKKIASVFILALLFFLLNVCVGYAGDVPEALLHGDGAQLYFGKVTELTDTSVTVLPVKKIKGDVELNKEIVYAGGLHMATPGEAQEGKTYLVGYVDENNLYCWATDGTDTKTLKIKNASGMNLRMQQYLNNGDFEKAEQERLAKAGTTAASELPPTLRPTPSLAAVQSPASTLSPAQNDPSTPAAATGQPAFSKAVLKPGPGAFMVVIVIAAVLALSGAIAFVATRKAKKR